MNTRFLRQKLKTLENQLSTLKAHELELEAQNKNLRQIQQNIEECYRRYSNLYEQAPISYIVLDQSGNITDINRVALEFFHAPREAVLKKPFIDFVSDEDSDRWQTLFQNFMTHKGESRQTIDLALKNNDGAIFNACLECVFTEEGGASPELCIALSPDKSAEQYKDGDLDNQLDTLNPEVDTGTLQLLGNIEEIFEVDGNGFDGTYKTFLSYVHPEDRKKVINAIATAIKNKLPYQITHRLQMKDGRIKWVEGLCLVYYGPDGRAEQTTCMIHDVTKQMEINDLLRIGIQQYKDFFETIHSGVLYLDNECRILCANPAAENILGMPASELMGMSLLDPAWRIIGEESLGLPTKIHPVVMALQTGQRISNLVLGLWNPKLNEHVWLSIDTIPQYRPNEDKRFAVYVCFDDISKRKKIENRLAAAEKRYRALLFGASDAICIVNLNGDLEEMNRSAQRLLGLDRQQKCCIHFTEFHLEEDLPEALRYFNDVCERGILEAFETRLVRKDNGAIVDVEIHTSLIEADGRVVVQSILIDISDRKKQEQERLAKELTLRHALVREVHHRIKNNLQGIMGVLCQFAQSHPELAEPMNQAISQMNSVAIIHGLQGRAYASDVRLCDLIEAIATEIAHLWQKSVKMDTPDDWMPFSIAESEAVPMALILNELISNAIKYNLGNNPIEISMKHGATPNDVNISIYNSGCLPDNFDTQRSGLNLATLLMPPTGASLSWQQQGDVVITRLNLSGPIITLETQL